MVSTTVGKSLVAVACLVLLHAAYSTYEHLSILKALGKPSDDVPTSIIIEACISILFFLPGIAMASAELQDITWRGEMAKRATEDSDARMAFLPLGPAVWNHQPASITEK